MLICGLQKVTLIDFPGCVAATVFLGGCNFRCPWCYSKELVLPQNMKSQPKISELYFFNFLKERRNLLGGVVVCGGEPTIHKELPVFLKKIKKMGFPVKLDTNGSNPDVLKKLIDGRLVDYVAMDIKQNPKSKIEQVPRKREQNPKYDRATGVKIDLDKINQSIEIIKNSGVDYEFRTTLVPGVHTKEDIIEIAKWLSPAKKYFLQGFRPEKTIDPKFEKEKPYSDGYLVNVQQAVSPFFETCEIR